MRYLATLALAAGLTAVAPAHFVFVSVTDDGTDRVATLTPHQRTILRLFALGMSAKEIARKLDISSRTVESHKYQIMESLAVQSSAELVRVAIRHGIVEP